MRRILIWLVIPCAVLIIAALSIVGVRVWSAEELPPPDPALPIVFDDGSSMPLAEALDRARRGLPLPVAAPTFRQSLLANLEFKATIAVDGDPDGLLDAPVGSAGPLDDPIYELAEQNRADGKLDQALALYLSIPEDSKHYARARRIVAWNILARDQGKPEQAVRYANQALHAAPLDGNAWQDWYRVYARTLGLPVD
jgi:tetratricopeptide (TPR) repeat protein